MRGAELPDGAFGWWRGRFYCVIGSLRDGDARVTVVWEMRHAHLDENLPEQVQRVVIEPDGAADPSDVDGRTWQQRTTAAELAAADARARIDGMTADMVADQRRYQDAVTRARGREQEYRLGMDDAYDKVHALALAVANVYKLTEPWDELHSIDGGDIDDAGRSVPRPPSIAELAEFALGALQGTHPSVVAPRLGPNDVTEMAHIIGRRLTAGETLASGVYAATRAILDPPSIAAQHAQHDPAHRPQPGCKLCEDWDV